MKVSTYIIEDDIDFGRMLLQTLRSAQLLEVSGWAMTAADAQAEMDKTMHDIYLVDISLPDGSGIDLMRDISQRAPRAKIMAMSTLGNDKYLVQSLRSGASGFLVKSEMPANFIQQIITLVNGGAYLSPQASRLLVDEISNRANNTIEATSGKPLGARTDGSPAQPAAPVTPKETQILSHLQNGSPAKVIAHELGISVFTVNQHLRNIYRKLNVRNKMEAVRVAQRQGVFMG